MQVDLVGTAQGRDCKHGLVALSGWKNLDPPNLYSVDVGVQAGQTSQRARYPFFQEYTLNENYGSLDHSRYISKNAPLIAGIPDIIWGMFLSLGCL